MQTPKRVGLHISYKLHGVFQIVENISQLNHELIP